jgi:UPF0755 protein
MTRTRPTLYAFFILTVLVGMVILIAILASTALSYPQQAEALYGPASPRLSTLQHLRLSFLLVQDQNLLLIPANPTGDEFIFKIAIDEPTGNILNNLEAVGLIPDQDAVRNYLVYSGLDTQLQAGDFLVSPVMTPVEIIGVMLDPTPLYVTISIFPGWRIEEIAEHIQTTGLAISIEEFIVAAHGTPQSYEMRTAVPYGVSLEGFLAPGTYEVLRDSTADELIVLFVNTFEERLNAEMLGGFTQQGLTLYQAVTLASIVERETVVLEEMPMIASVFLNRIKAGMKLEADPTVQYAVGYNNEQGTWWTNPLYYSHLEFDSPFNTYMYPGLPPTPIANPSLEALQAVAFPAESGYYFFQAVCDGSGRHNFAYTYEEHIQNNCP